MYILLLYIRKMTIYDYFKPSSFYFGKKHNLTELLCYYKK